MITPEQIIEIIEESMFDCYPQWRNLTPSDLPIVAEKIASLINTAEDEQRMAIQNCTCHFGDDCPNCTIAEDKCICCSRVDDYMVTPNPDCPLHGGLHGKNPYKED